MEKATDRYRRGIVNCNLEVKRYERLINRFSVLRLLSIGAGIFLFYQSLKFDSFWLPVFVFFIVILVFSMLVRQQNRFEKTLNYYRDLAVVYKNEADSMAVRGNIYSEGAEWMDDTHPYTSDLDIFGSRSLYELINRCATISGNAILAGWLIKRAAAPVIRERQAAIAELALKEDWRHHFQALLLFCRQEKVDHVQNLLGYLKLAPAGQSQLIRFYVRWIPGIFLAVAFVAWFYPVVMLVLIALGIVNLLLTQSYSSLIAKADAQIGKVSRTLDRFSEAIVAIRSEEWDSPFNRRLAARLEGDQQGELAKQIKRLALLINQLALGMSSVGPVLNFIMIWNIRHFFVIEDWKKTNKMNLQGAFDVIANFEALISLSSLRSNYPEWTFPEVDEQEKYTLSAEALGHPLIPLEQRIDNDYRLDNELKIDIITGSNMAGKSTFLRTLGINTVLALSGAPVCARQMRVSPMLIFSYMRIKDSLNENTSTFKAELDRLQSLLGVLGKEDKVFFLIDEMLRGTNSVDKYLGSKAVIEKLIAQKAVGIIATHDLQIADLEKKYPEYIRNYYFDIQVAGAEMKFDYKLKKGECKTFNASILLERLGIRFEDDSQLLTNKH
jgi:hypothetical protein